MSKQSGRKKEKIGTPEAMLGTTSLAEPHEVAELLRTQGWAAIRSGALSGEVVVWVRDEQVTVPPPWQFCVRYTQGELFAIADTPLAAEQLRQLHAAKRVFNGTVCGKERDSDLT